MWYACKKLIRSVPEVEVLYVDDECLEHVDAVTVVNLAVYLPHAETLLAAEEGLKDLVTILVEDVPASARNEYLGQQFLRPLVLLVYLQVLNQEFRVFAQTLTQCISTILNCE